MTQNRDFGSAGSAMDKTANEIDKARNGDFGETMQNAYGTAAEGIQQGYEDVRDMVTQVSYDAYDAVGETLRAGEAYARRKPIHALAAVAAAGLVLGYIFAVRSAPRASGVFSRWR